MMSSDDKKDTIEHIKKQVKWAPLCRFSCDDYNCDDCGKLMKTKLEADLHRTSGCSSILPHECKDCGLRFKDKNKLSKHSRIHASPSKVYQCENCKANFNWKSNLNRHKKTTSCIKKTFRCLICNRTFQRHLNLVRHQALICKIGPYPVHPGSRFARRSYRGNESGVNPKVKTEPDDVETPQSYVEKDLKEILAVRVNSEDESKIFISPKKNSKQRFECATCKLHFKFKSDWFRHVKIHERPKPFVCDICNLGFSWKSNLVRHQRNFHLNKMSFRCYQCNIGFVEKNHLERHRKIHEKAFKVVFRKRYRRKGEKNAQTRDKPFKRAKSTACTSDIKSEPNSDPEDKMDTDVKSIAENKSDQPNILPKDDFAEKDAKPNNVVKNVQEEEAKHSELTNSLNKSADNLHLSCSKCDRVFSRKSSHFQHERSHTKVKLKCTWCTKVFERQTALLRHQLIHTGEKKFTCNICKHSFRQKYQLVQHMNIHNGIKPYKCPICLRRFGRKSILVRHKLIHDVLDESHMKVEVETMKEIKSKKHLYNTRFSIIKECKHENQIILSHIVNDDNKNLNLCEIDISSANNASVNVTAAQVENTQEQPSTKKELGINELENKNVISEDTTGVQLVCSNSIPSNSEEILKSHLKTNPNGRMLQKAEQPKNRNEVSVVRMEIHIEEEANHNINFEMLSERNQNYNKKKEIENEVTLKRASNKENCFKLNVLDAPEVTNNVYVKNSSSDGSSKNIMKDSSDDNLNALGTKRIEDTKVGSPISNVGNMHYLSLSSLNNGAQIDQLNEDIECRRKLRVFPDHSLSSDICQKGITKEIILESKTDDQEVTTYQEIMNAVGEGKKLEQKSDEMPENSHHLKADEVNENTSNDSSESDQSQYVLIHSSTVGENVYVSEDESIDREKDDEKIIKSDRKTSKKQKVRDSNENAKPFMNSLIDQFQGMNFRNMINLNENKIANYKNVLEHQHCKEASFDTLLKQCSNGNSTEPCFTIKECPADGSQANVQLFVENKDESNSKNSFEKILPDNKGNKTSLEKFPEIVEVSGHDKNTLPTGPGNESYDENPSCDTSHYGVKHIDVTTKQTSETQDNIEPEISTPYASSSRSKIKYHLETSSTFSYLSSSTDTTSFSKNKTRDHKISGPLSYPYSTSAIASCSKYETSYYLEAPSSSYSSSPPNALSSSIQTLTPMPSNRSSSTVASLPSQQLTSNPVPSSSSGSTDDIRSDLYNRYLNVLVYEKTTKTSSIPFDAVQFQLTSGVINNFVCTTCKRHFKRKEDLVRHRFTEHIKRRLVRREP